MFKGFVYTEGVKYLAETGKAYWLIDFIFSNQLDSKLRTERFQTWTLTVDDSKGSVIVTDGNGNKLATFTIDYTDLPLPEITLWFIDNTLLLPSEY